MHAIAAIFGEQARLAERLLAALARSSEVATTSDVNRPIKPKARSSEVATTSDVNRPIKPLDGSHDLSHLLRIWHNARTIAAHEPGSSPAIVTAAVILHDCVAVEKDAPERAFVSQMAATKARTILAELGWDRPEIDATAHAIEAHSFSAAIPPRTLEARIVQDADRLDAIGAIGIARCFYVAGRMGSSLYDPADPRATHRDLDDRTNALDHFGVKLFRIAENFQTKTGQALAERRTQTMHRFVEALLNEIEGESK